MATTAGSLAHLAKYLAAWAPGAAVKTLVDVVAFNQQHRAEELAKLGAKRAITSPLARSRETAAQYEKLMETHARIESGVGEVITPDNIADRSEWLRGVMMGNWSAMDPGLQAWRQTVLATVEKLPDDTAVFSHFVAINVIVGLLTGDDRVVVFKPGHASITKLDRRGGKLVVAELGSEAATVVT